MSNLLLFILSAGIAFGQEMNPWGDEPAEEPEPEDTASDLPVDPTASPWDPMAEEAVEPEATPEETEAEDEVIDGESYPEAEKGDGSDGDGEQPAAAPSPTIEIAPMGLRIAQNFGGSGVWFSEEAVLGVDGNVHITTVHARYAANHFALVGHIPFAGYVTPDGADSNLGNLRIGAWYFFQEGTMKQGAGLEVHANLGTSAWAWANQAEELWPSYGVTANWQIQYDPGHFIGEGFPITFMTRASGGLIFAKAYAPYPPLYIKLQGSVGFDKPLHKLVGLVGEATIRYWDISPFEIAGLVRADPMPGFRVRTGLVAPLSVWAGWVPTDSPAGVREVTWIGDVMLAF
jgi:hypothetical protein